MREKGGERGERGSGGGGGGGVRGGHITRHEAKCENRNRSQRLMGAISRTVFYSFNKIMSAADDGSFACLSRSPHRLLDRRVQLRRQSVTSISIYRCK